MKLRNRDINIIGPLVICLFAFTSMRAQDVHFSQFYMTPLLLNPAEAGARYEMQGILNYRSQWSSIANPYSTANGSFDMRLGRNREKGYSGIGLNIDMDKTGFDPLKTFQAHLSYAYHIRIDDRNTFTGGLTAGIIQRSISTTSIQWMNQYDGTSYNSALPSGEPTFSNSRLSPDVGVGLHYGFNKSERYMTGNDHRVFHAGIAVTHINRPVYSFYNTNEKLFMKTTAYMNAELGVGNSDWSIVPGLVFWQQGPAQEILMGSMFQLQLGDDSKYTGYVQASSISMGAYYRNKDAAVVSLLYKSAQFSAGLSYDINLSGLKSASNGRGGFEISLRYTNRNAYLYKKHTPSI